MNAARTSLFLMANLGAEASRLIAAKERLDADAAKAALARAESILGEIAHLPDMKPRAEELAALLKASRSIAGDEPRKISSLHLKSYFVPFAMRLMTRK